MDGACRQKSSLAAFAKRYGGPDITLFSPATASTLVSLDLMDCINAYVEWQTVIH